MADHVDPGSPDHPDRLGEPRWDGSRDRMEVWYATFTDPATGEGFWLHWEVLARTDGSTQAYGWAAAFPPDEPPTVERFGPEPVIGGVPPAGEGTWFDAAGARVGPGVMAGETRTMSWDLAYRDAAPPLFTFPSYVWHRQLLPSAQCVPWPSMEVSGTFTVGERTVNLDKARGGLSRIYGHGNAQHWGWLHADLGDGDVLEIVAAKGRRPGLRLVPPKVFAQLRVDGADWPSDPVVTAGTSRARLDLPRWYATVTTATKRLRVAVRVPPTSSVTLEYRDPDDAQAFCTNSCRADAEVRLERRAGLTWQPERRWSLRGTAHAEIGERP